MAVGALGLLALPIGVAASRLKSVGLLEAMEIAVPAAFVLGVVAVSLARRARFSLERSIRRPGERAVRISRFLAWAGIYIACSGGIALGFYGLLVLRGG